MRMVIFGCGKIANRIAKAFEYVDNCELVGFASKDLNKAKQYSQKYHLSEYGTYDYFLNRKDIDAIYLATYNASHYELIQKCLLSHKHVICEKPMLSDIEANKQLFSLAQANNCLLMEAMKAVFLPINNKVKELIKENIIGEVKYLEASFIRASFFDDNHWIYDLKTGGALKDLGSYCAAITNFLMDKNPEVLYKYKNDIAEKADTIGETIINYDGIIAHLLVSNAMNGNSALKVYGTKGYIVVEEFWKASKGYYVVDNQRFDFAEELISDFHYEIQHFVDLINNHIYQSPIMSQSASENILLITQ